MTLNLDKDLTVMCLAPNEPFSFVPILKVISNLFAWALICAISVNFGDRDSGRNVHLATAHRYFTSLNEQLN